MRRARMFSGFWWALVVLGLSLHPLFYERVQAQDEPGEFMDRDQRLKQIPTYVHKKIYRKAWKEKEVEFNISSAAIGDFNGDGLNELVTTDGHRLRILQWKYGQFRPLHDDDSRREDRFSSFWPWKKASTPDPFEKIHDQNRATKYIRLSSADLDEDGRDEIVVIAVRDRRLFSGILDFEPPGFAQKISEAGLYLKIFQEEDGRTSLAGQSLASSTIETHRYAWDGTTLRKGPLLRLPQGANLFSMDRYRSEVLGGTAYVSLCTPAELCFFLPDLTKTDHAQNVMVPTQCTIRINETPEKGKSLKRSFRVPRRILSGDFQRDGRDEVLLILERPVMNVWGLRSMLIRYMVADLVLMNANVVEFWNTEPILGDILDQAVGDINNDGKDDLVLFASKGWTPFTRGTRIMIYELQ